MSSTLRASLVTAILIVLSGCASRPPAQFNVLIPAEGDRPASLVPLPSNWAAATVRTLRAFPGCTGVELAATGTGKQAIFAMFKDKAALINWYRSDTHQQFVAKVSFYREDAGDFIPAAGMTGDGPIMVVATMTPVAVSEDIPERTVLLSVELFCPTPGGVQFGGASLLPR